MPARRVAAGLRWSTGVAVAGGAWALLMRNDVWWWFDSGEDRGHGSFWVMGLAAILSGLLAFLAGVFAYARAAQAADLMLAELRRQAVRERATMVALASSSRMKSAKNDATTANATEIPNATCTPLSAWARPDASSLGDSAP